MNYDKSSFMIIGQPKNKPNINMFIGEKSIKRVFSTKILGIIIDHKLYFNEHINYLCENLNKKISFFSRLRRNIHVQTSKLAFEALVFPTLDYGINVYNLIFLCLFI